MAENSTIRSIPHTPKNAIETDSSDSKENETSRRAYLTLLGSILVLYASSGLTSSFGFFQDFYSREFLRETPNASIAFIGTLQMALINLMAAVSGALCDRYGIKHLFLGSGFGVIITLFILSFAQPERFRFVFVTQGVLMGLSVSFGVQPAITVVGQHFERRRALAMGLVSTGSALGGIGFPLMLSWALPEVGFAVAVRLAALKVAVCYFIALCFSTSKLRKSCDERTRSCCIDFGGFLDPRYAVLCVGTWFAVLGLWLPAYYIKTYADNVYHGNNVSRYFLCMMNGCSMLGATFSGLLGDHLGRLNLLWPITLFSGCLCLFLWLLSNDLATLILFVCTYGFSASSVTALPTSIIGEITPSGRLGARTGAFFSVITISSLVGTPIGVALITDEHVRAGYTRLIVFSGTALIIGSMFMLGSRMLNGKHSYRKRQMEIS